MKIQYLGFILPITVFTWLFIWSWIPIKLRMCDYIGQNVIKASVRIFFMIILIMVSLNWALGY